MESTNGEKPGLTDQVKQYIETRIKLARLQAIEKGTSFSASLITEVFVLLCTAVTILFFSITLALYLGATLGAYWMGFGIVALIYLFIAVFVAVFDKKFIEPKIINFLIKKLLGKKGEENGDQ
ncbi:phage holin family protein [Mucilaginibacter sp. HMF5004]|uniref:phage holin family protein n=1 Tax=Mucilaginibacter rivuli TaxID=2857527 RepID=UPI001C6071EB|nr:phage holin family protein [Mucilaginibacter rivuli]MBW4888098.1 phage holin family protein [Mucilaginibacter rivuli]